MNRKIFQALSFLLACQLFSLTVWAKPVWPSDVGIEAEIGIVVDMDSGTVLFGQNIHVASPPASITKILTALIIIENCDLSDTVTFSDTAMNSVEADSGNRLSLEAGDTMSVEDALYAMLLVSCNQAANALAEHAAGSISDFVDLMNDRAAQLGCTESHFDNPSGLNGDTQYVTAFDMAKIARAAYENPQLLAISEEKSWDLPATANNPDGQTIRTEHRLLYTDDETSDYYYPAAKAGKTGYLRAAGNTLVTYAEQDGRRLIAVILKGQPYQYFKDTITLFNFGFDRFYNLEIAQEEGRYVTGSEIIELPTGSFAASDLAVEAGRIATLPDGAVFSDAEFALEDLSSGNISREIPANAAAHFSYTYDERNIGSAFLLIKNAAAADGEDALSDADDIDNTADGAAGGTGSAGTSPESGAGEDAADGSQESGGSGLENADDPAAGGDPPQAALTAGSLLTAGAAALAVLILLFFIRLRHLRKKEAEAREERRRRRRERLAQDGMQEEFDRLLAERRQMREK